MSWQTKPLSDVCDFQRGLTYAKGDEVAESGNVVLRANNIDLATNQLDLSELRFVRGDIAIPDAKRVRKNSLIVCTASGSKNHLGKAAIIEHDLGYAFGGFMGQITPSSELVPRYLFHLMTSNLYKDFIDSLSDGANINNLKFDDLGRFSVPFPNLTEQHRIVAILDEAFAGIATAKANAEKSLRNTQSAFDEYVGAIFSAGSWPSTTLDMISENLDSRRVPITKNVREAGSYPYYGASGIVDYVADYIFDHDALLVSEDGANLLARSTPIAFSVSGKYWVNNHAHILRFKDMATQKFVEHYLESIPLDDYITGAAQPKLNQKALNSIPIPLPATVQKRAEVVSRIEAMRGEVSHLQSITTRKLAALDELKQSLLQQAFSGQL